MAAPPQSSDTLTADEFAARVGVLTDDLEGLWREWAVVRFDEDGEDRYPAWQLADGSIINPSTHRLLAHASQAEIAPRQLHKWMVSTGAAGEFAGDPDGVITRFDAEHGL